MRIRWALGTKNGADSQKRREEEEEGVNGEGPIPLRGQEHEQDDIKNLKHPEENIGRGLTS